MIAYDEPVAAPPGGAGEPGPARDSATLRPGSLPSPLRYPGGKLWLVDYIAHLLDRNGLRPRLFVEPFAGGASVALSLLARDKVDAIGLVDRDPLVAAFSSSMNRVRLTCIAVTSPCII